MASVIGFSFHSRCVHMSIVYIVSCVFVLFFFSLSSFHFIAIWRIQTDWYHSTNIFDLNDVDFIAYGYVDLLLTIQSICNKILKLRYILSFFSLSIRKCQLSWIIGKTIYGDICTICELCEFEYIFQSIQLRV